jgi:O-antigen/teichoic acid export membrane protein
VISLNKGLGLRRFARDSLLNLIRQGWTIFIGLGVSILLARALGKDSRGILTLALLLPEVLFILINLGIAPATVYFVGRGTHTPEQATHNNIILSGVISVFGLLFGIIVCFTLAKFLFPGVPQNILLISLPILPLTMVMAFLNAIFQGLQDFRTFNFVTMISQLILLILVFLIVWVFAGGIPGAICSYIVSILVGVIILLAKLKNKISSPLFKINKSDLIELMTYGIKAHIGNITTYLNYRVDNIILNAKAGSGSVGLYSVSVSIAERFWIPANAAGAVILPRIASLGDDEERKSQITPLTARLVFWFSIGMALVAWPISYWAIPFLYSQEYQGSIEPFLLILPGVAMLNIAKILANDISGRGRPEINTIISVIALITNIFANLILIPKLYSAGAALSSTISYSILAILTIYTYCHLTKVNWYKLIFLNKEDFTRIRKLFTISAKKIFIFFK